MEDELQALIEPLSKQAGRRCVQRAQQRVRASALRMSSRNMSKLQTAEAPSTPRGPFTPGYPPAGQGQLRASPRSQQPSPRSPQQQQVQQILEQLPAEREQQQDIIETGLNGLQPLSPQGATGFGNESSPLINEAGPPPRKFGCWQRMFLRHHNERFADNAEFSFRSACCALAIALPFILPKGTFALAEWAKARGFYTRNTVLMFILTVDKTAGETLANAFAGTLGSILSVLNSSLMHWVIRGGVTPDTPWFVLIAVVAYGVAFVWMVLWLNFEMNTRIFCLLTFAYHWMDFLNPFSGECRPTMICGPTMGEIVSAMVACALAVLCNLVPTPVLALRRARVNSKECTGALTRAWLDFSAYFCGTHSSDYRHDRLVTDLQKIREALDSIDGLLINSWYELGWLQSVRNIRESITRLRRSLQECSDRLFCMWNTCLQESFGGVHDDLMPRLWPHVYRVLVEGGRLLTHTTEVACGGRVFDSEEPSLRDASERTRAAVANLAIKFREAKATLGVESITEELLDEQNFLLHVSAFGRVAADLAEDLLAKKSSLRPLPAAEDPASIFERTTLSDRVHLSFATRSLVTILLGFLLGIFGYSKTLLKYDAGIAAFAALLVRKSVGSSGARNLQRLRGVVVGTAVGHVTYAMVGWCVWWGYLFMAASLFLWVGASLLAHHDAVRAGGVGAGLAVGHSAAGASAGLLSAYFGADGMMEHCTEQVYTVLDVLGRSYYVIIDSLVAVGLAFLVDTLLAPEPASQLAAKAYGEVWHCLSSALSDVLDPKAVEVKMHSSESAHKLRVAEILGHQADREPRYWRLPWRSSLYSDAMQSAVRLRMSLCGMECSVLEGGRYGAGKAEKIRRLTSLQTFAAMRRVAQEEMDHMESLVDQVISKETGDFMRALGNPFLKRNFIAEYMQATRMFIQEANKLPEVSSEKLASNSSLENDVATQACLLLSCVASMVAEAQTLRSSVLQWAL